MKASPRSRINSRDSSGIPAAKLTGMVFVQGGVFSMGSENFYPEEAPIRRVAVDSFWLDETPVTNRQFSDFVQATGHVTAAEIAPDPTNYPGLLEGMDRAGSLVFRKPALLPRETGPQDWWHFEVDACWKQPLGADGDLDALDLWDHPVVHVAYDDALAYAKWAGKDLPTEAEFEYAARAGLEGVDYAWGDELAPDGQMMANYWQGRFPFANQCLDGWERTSPVKSFPPNGYGLFDMIGNTWEWTRDWWSDGADLREKKPIRTCCTISNPRGGTLRNSFDPAYPELRIGRKVIKGGSHLCAANYCQRYRPAARHPEMTDTATTHIGFRCIVRGSGSHISAARF